MIADDLVAAFLPWINEDLEVYLRAMGGMFAEVETILYEDEDTVPWEVLLDPDRCPVSALPYLAQYVGEQLPLGIEENAAREWIKDSPNQRRGTVESIFYAAQRKLVGERAVSLRERTFNGSEDEDTIEVNTYVPQTPNQQAVLQEILTVMPADIVLVYTVLPGQTWADVLAFG